MNQMWRSWGHIPAHWPECAVIDVAVTFCSGSPHTALGQTTGTTLSLLTSVIVMLGTTYILPVANRGPIYSTNMMKLNLKYKTNYLTVGKKLESLKCIASTFDFYKWFVMEQSEFAKSLLYWCWAKICFLCGINFYRDHTGFSLMFLVYPFSENLYFPNNNNQLVGSRFYTENSF